MKTCEKCGHVNPDNAVFCKNPKCGHMLSHGGKGQQNNPPRPQPQQPNYPPRPQPQPNGPSSQGNSSIFDSLNNYMGNSSSAPLNWRDLFANVFKKHTSLEAEDLFIYGTRRTTPPLYAVSSDWPKPWLYSRVLIGLVITFFFVENRCGCLCKSKRHSWCNLYRFDGFSCGNGVLVYGNQCVSQYQFLQDSARFSDRRSCIASINPFVICFHAT